MRNSKLRSVRVALAVFLAKFRLGLSNRVLATIFDLKGNRTVSKIINQLRQVLTIDFVPHRIGLNHKLCIVMDDTYIPIQNQDEYILAVFGPFLADGHNNNASIIQHIMKNDDQGIASWLHDDDVIIVDHGFRDAVNSMEELGLCVEIPSFLKGKKQFSTQEANRTRTITKNLLHNCIVNGKTKEWKYFNYLQNSSLRFLPDDMDIVCALHNAFRQAVMRDPTNGIELAKIMLEQIQKENELDK
ncbi:unnamed protein product, partial [Adineta ricciae]